jgi:hypothetical protein
MTAVRSAIALGLFVTVLVAACQPEGRIFEVTLGTESNDRLPVTLTDGTRLVTGIAQAAVDPVTVGNEPAVRADPDDPTGLVLTWLGGGCDQDAALRFHVVNGGYVLNLASHGKLGLGGCPAIGLPRAVRIAVSRPIPVDAITVAGG